jgi:hypothetical protein
MMITLKFVYLCKMYKQSVTLGELFFPFKLQTIPITTRLSENFMKFTFAVAGACIALLSATATALAQAPRASTTTQDFVAMCSKTTDVAAQNFCHGFGQGVYETYLITRHPKKAPAFICAAESKNTRQDYINGFVKWSAANPKFNQMSAADTILRYLAETLPCKKG